MYNIVLYDENDSFLEKLQQTLIGILGKMKCEYSIEKWSDPQTILGNIEVRNKSCNIIFLGIDSDSGQVFRTAEILNARDHDYILILVSTSCDQAVEGYKYGAYRWIVKNNLRSGVAEAIHSLDILIGGSRNEGEPLIRFKYLNNEDYDYISVRERDIIQLYKKNRRVIMTTPHGNYELLQYTLNYYKKLINNPNFIIASRSHLINLVHIEELRGDFFQLSDGQTICIGSEGRVKQQVKKEYLNYVDSCKKYNFAQKCFI
ncbi:hypothetical protein P40081_32345 [Paenibacillus sp. FSL P4-0081]|jgi:DNA-binding LytR/AlgR family response regulator|uniref:LytTR family transcriptional regulator DNA-binding domain-containing protein n=2 Tax=Paenibacillus TaxID=44249 RepID=UPI0004F60819|nr:LytTR family transcriptional regulator DNA-binding domain-containing protein [Paenibacillus sp. FSL P4-0081]AIQ32280.1 hypothetical protein P40081_32345 [Paenibacillus sp. FSL P4-0081]OMF22438.1 hypothetical protein BK132_29570 [Paenibacillus sp. FSL H8-0259]